MSEEDCKGVFYRGKNNHFINKKGHIVNDQRLIPLIRKSCTGCPVCESINECIIEEMENVGEIVKDIQDGALYRIWVYGDQYMTDCGMEYDWELLTQKVEE